MSELILLRDEPAWHARLVSAGKGAVNLFPVVWLVLVGGGGLVAGLLLADASTTPSSAILEPPGFDRLLGTDSLGRDVFKRVLAGASVSIRVAFLAVAIGIVCGGLLGMIAAIVPRFADETIMRSFDVILAFPTIVLALLVSLLLGPALVFVAILIGVVISPQIARLVRSRVVVELQLGYVDAERSTGASWSRILGVHVLRNIAAPIGAYSLLLVADAMLFEAALSFVGIGIQPPRASWGNMILEGQALLIGGSWWVSIFPGAVLFLTVMSLNLVADRWLTPADFDIRHQTAK